MHRAVGEWFETLGAERSEDRAEMLAHHYGAALELLRAAGLPTEQLIRPTRDALFEAGQRAWALGAAAEAQTRLEHALDLTDQDDPEWPGILLAYGSVLVRTKEQGQEELATAASALENLGENERAAIAERRLAELLWLQGRVPESVECLRRGLNLLADRPASPEKAEVLLAYWRNAWLAGLDPPDATLDEALSIADQLGRNDLVVTARINRAMRLGFDRGDRAGVEENHHAIELANEIGSAEITRAYINLASLQDCFGDKRLCAELHQQGLAIATRFGDVPRLRFLAGETISDRLSAGEWDQSLREAIAFIESCRSSPHYMEASARAAAASISLARDNLEGARAHLARLAELAAEIQDPQVTIPTDALHAFYYTETEDAGNAGIMINRILDVALPRRTLLNPAYVQAAIAAHDLGQPKLIAPVLGTASAETPWTRAVEAIADGRLTAAARECESAGELHFAAILAMRAAEGGEELQPGQQQQALAFSRSVGATRYLRRLESLPAAAL